MQSPAQFTLTFTFTNLFLHFIISTAVPGSCRQLLKQTLHHTVKQNRSLLSCERIKPVPSWFKHTPGIWHLGFLSSSSYSCYSDLRLSATTQNTRLPLQSEFNNSPLCTGSEHRERLALFGGEQLKALHTPQSSPCPAGTRQTLHPSPALSEAQPKHPQQLKGVLCTDLDPHKINSCSSTSPTSQSSATPTPEVREGEMQPDGL